MVASKLNPKPDDIYSTKVAYDATTLYTDACVITHTRNKHVIYKFKVSKQVSK